MEGDTRLSGSGQQSRQQIDGVAARALICLFLKNLPSFAKRVINIAIIFIDLQFGGKMESIKKCRRTFHFLVVS